MTRSASQPGRYGGGIYCLLVGFRDDPQHDRRVQLIGNPEESGRPAPSHGIQLRLRQRDRTTPGSQTQRASMATFPAEPLFVQSPGSGPDGLWGTADDVAANCTCWRAPPVVTPAIRRLFPRPEKQTSTASPASWRTAWISAWTSSRGSAMSTWMVTWTWSTCCTWWTPSARTSPIRLQLGLRLQRDGFVDVVDLLDLVYDFGR